jgi:phenylglyoxylate dehydrogenase beta subunit
MEDYYAKLKKAIEASKQGMSYIHIFSPCPTGWRFSPSQLIEVARRAVEANMVPLWEYDNKEGIIHFTHPVENPLPVDDYLKLIGKYRHLSNKQISHIRLKTEEHIKRLKSFSRQREKEKVSAAT